jgi:Transposase IS66 family
MDGARNQFIPGTCPHRYFAGGMLVCSKIRDQVLPKSAAGQAVAYALKNWTALTRYCEDGDLEIDSNTAEGSLRGIAVGRNNRTFFGSDNGGKTAAVLRTFVASCERVKSDPWAWLLDDLLPHHWSLASK